VGERAFEKSLRVECAVEQLAGGLKKKIPVSVQRCLPSGAKAKSRGCFHLRADFCRLPGCRQHRQDDRNLDLGTYGARN
jgi:hypothetical protein